MQSDGRALIERGTILRVAEDGYTVASTDRPGITTPTLKALNGGVYDVNAAVYFFVFDDGDGGIIGPM